MKNNLTFFFVYNPFAQNDSSVGLGGSVWGHNTKEASKIASMLQSGTAWVNQHKVMTPNTVSHVVLLFVWLFVVVFFLFLSSTSHSSTFHSIPFQILKMKPFGGFKESGIGRENGLGGLLNYLEPQVKNTAKVSWAKL